MNDLPIELAQEIAELIADPKDLLSLRQTCRIIESQTLQPFCERFFRLRHLRLTISSLQSLILISKSERISRHVKKLIVYYEPTHEWLNPGVIGYELLLAANLSNPEPHGDNWSQVHMELNVPSDVPLQIDMLRTALAHFTSLESIGFGISSIYQEALSVIYPEHLDQLDDISNENVNTILQAISTSGVRLKSLSLFHPLMVQSKTLDPMGLFYPYALWDQNKQQLPFPNLGHSLKRLDMTIGDGFHSDGHLYDTWYDVPAAVIAVTRFFSELKQLEVLTLRLCGVRAEFQHDPLSALKYIEGVMQEMYFPKLRFLALPFLVQALSSWLAGLLTRHQSLREVSFYAMTIEDNERSQGWMPIFEILKNEQFDKVFLGDLRWVDWEGEHDQCLTGQCADGRIFIDGIRQDCTHKEANVQGHTEIVALMDRLIRAHGA
jgi:hypothetical protein